MAAEKELVRSSDHKFDEMNDRDILTFKRDKLKYFRGEEDREAERLKNED
ncbi:5974_t:CDS:2 [Acaulospora colombiana]|uniref:5974_t:CDS:1 n=1 Tax=Acaulospora colombiana TaxID=27376 RepID=A0ACA9L5M9_9GLOM|nr:5974_t:CDS:2 [Acaulospora colombiana]